jgi:predicted ribosomally synthesized peptide with SipW-like signal peptide
MKKVLSLTLAFALVLAIGIGGTLAWLTDQTDPIVNTFTIGDIEIDLEEGNGPNFKVTPGQVVDKDPEVTVKAGSEACYLFVKVEEGGNFSEYLAMI